jgi:hypothetical protein
MKRVEEIEDFKGGGGISHQGLQLEFALWGDPPPRVFFTVSNFAIKGLWLTR